MSIRTQASPNVGYPLIAKASSLVKKAAQNLQRRKSEPREPKEGFLQQYERMPSEVVRLTIPRDF